MEIGTYDVKIKLFYSNDDKKVGYAQTYNHVEQKAEFEYLNLEEARAKYNIMIGLSHQNLRRMIALNQKCPTNIAYEPHEKSLKDIVDCRTRFWVFNDANEAIGFTVEFRKFLLCIWDVLLYLKAKNLDVSYANDFAHFLLVNGDLSNPKLHLKNVSKRLHDRTNLKGEATFLKSLVHDILHRHQKAGQREVKSLFVTLDAFQSSKLNGMVLNEHPLITDIDGGLSIFWKVFKFWNESKRERTEEALIWFRQRSISYYYPWDAKVDDEEFIRVYDNKSVPSNQPSIRNNERYSENLDGLVTFMRDVMLHSYRKESMENVQKYVLGYFEERFPGLILELYYYLHSITVEKEDYRNTTSLWTSHLGVRKGLS